MTKILVISPHPDDESIGCGGTIRHHIQGGAVVHAVFLTSGEKGGHGLGELETQRLREQEACAASHVLGIASVDFYHEPDGAVRATAGLISRLSATIAKLRPARIYVPHDREMHPDHRAAARALARALSPIRSTKRIPQPEALMYEVWTPLSRFDEIVDISDYVDVKRAAIQEYHSQCRVMAFDEAILGLNRYRGEMHCWPGGDYAEVFRRLRW